jgi:hypothetical protein
MNYKLQKLHIAHRILLFSFFLFPIGMNAQNEIDALRFSETDWQGTARFMGAGRAFGAVGAEFSSLSINPAAIGLYKKSEVTFTPLTLSIYKNSSGYNETTTLAQSVKYNLNSAGIVLVLPGVSSTLWKKFPIGFGFNRIKNYNNTFSMEGRNDGKTIGSAFASAAEGYNYQEAYSQDGSGNYIWTTELWAAWDSFLIDTIQGNKSSYLPLLEGVDMLHSSTITQTGGNDEMSFSLGANYDDKLFLGATIGIPFLNFTENRTFLEKNDKESNNYDFQYFKIIDKLTVHSTGINLKLGIIYQPFNFLRVGIAFHTPTYYGNVKDSFSRQVQFKPASTVNNENYVNKFNYSLATPLRVMASTAFFIQQRAFISAEYEFTDYSMATLYAMSYSFSEENKEIQNKYGFCHIARIGTEINLSPIFALRAGYNYISSPYKDNINDGSKHYASAGLGFRTKYFYGDFAYAFTTSKEKYWMYDAAFVNAVNNKFITHRIILTMGVRF